MKGDQGGAPFRLQLEPVGAAPDLCVQRWGAPTGGRAVARVDDLRADYDRLGEILEGESDGSKAAALVRERRLVGELLEALETPSEVSVVDQLESRRRSRAGDAGSASRRRKSG